MHVKLENIFNTTKYFSILMYGDVDCNLSYKSKSIFNSGTMLWSNF
jgi:hypothetical protein